MFLSHSPLHRDHGVVAIWPRVLSGLVLGRMLPVGGREETGTLSGFSLLPGPSPALVGGVASDKGLLVKLEPVVMAEGPESSGVGSGPQLSRWQICPPGQIHFPRVKQTNKHALSLGLLV